MWRGLAVAGVALAAVLLWLRLPGPIERDPPRDLPWQLPDYRDARMQWVVGDDGLIRAGVEHFFLEDITPAMVAWFYHVLPISTVELAGVTYPLYHLFHPTEHGRIRVLEAAPGGEPGMAAGATVYREEWFGPYDSRGAALLQSFSDEGMVAIPRVAGIAIGEVRHSYSAHGGGTVYRVDAVIGSRLPLLGPLLNLYLRSRVFHPAMMEQWQRHQIEEVASLRYFLPELYALRGGAYHFRLSGMPRSGIGGIGAAKRVPGRPEPATGD